MRPKVVVKSQEVKALLRDLGITQNNLADLIGYQQPQISRILSGRLNPSNSFIASMLLAFEAPFALFFTIEGELA